MYISYIGKIEDSIIINRNIYNIYPLLIEAGVVQFLIILYLVFCKKYDIIKLYYIFYNMTIIIL